MQPGRLRSLAAKGRIASATRVPDVFRFADPAAVVLLVLPTVAQHTGEGSFPLYPRRSLLLNEPFRPNISGFCALQNVVRKRCRGPSSAPVFSARPPACIPYAPRAPCAVPRRPAHVRRSCAGRRMLCACPARALPVCPLCALCICLHFSCAPRAWPARASSCACLPMYVPPSSPRVPVLLCACIVRTPLRSRAFPTHAASAPPCAPAPSAHVPCARSPRTCPVVSGCGFLAENDGFA